MSSVKYILSKFDERITASVSTISFPISGRFVVDLPDGVQIDPPTDYVDLKTKKYAGISKIYDDFTDIIYDEFDNDTLIDYSAANTKASVGKYEVLLPETVGLVQTVPRNLGYTPSQVLVYWTVYSLARTTNAIKGKDLSYVENPAADVTCRVSFDGFATNDIAGFATMLTPTAPSPTISLRFTRTAGNGRYLGYYAVLYRP